MCRRRPSCVSIALLAALLALLGGCQSLQDVLGGVPKPTARVIGSSIRGISLDHAVLLFDVEVENPYAASLPLAQLRYALASAGTTFLEGTVQPTGAIPARGKQVIQLPATVRFAALFDVLKGVKAGAIVPYTADFRIGVDTPMLGRIDVPLSKSGELPVPAVPAVELTSLRIETLQVDQVKALARLRISNRNRFALEVSKLGVNLALAGQDVGGSRLNRPLSLPAGQSAAVDVPLSFSPRALGIGLVNLLRGEQIAYEVSGSIDADSRFGALSVPFRHIGNSAVSKQQNAPR